MLKLSDGTAGQQHNEMNAKRPVPADRPFHFRERSLQAYSIIR